LHEQSQSTGLLEQLQLLARTDLGQSRNRPIHCPGGLYQSEPLKIPMQMKICATFTACSEGIPSAGNELSLMAVSFQHFHARPFLDSANRSESHAYQTPRQIFGHLPWNSEEQFIVVPAMQRQLQGSTPGPRPALGVAPLGAFHFPHPRRLHLRRRAAAGQWKVHRRGPSLMSPSVFLRAIDPQRVEDLGKGAFSEMDCWSNRAPAAPQNAKP